MAKDKHVFVCSVCGAQSHKWQGKCFECDAYDSFVSQAIISTKDNSSLLLESVEAKQLNSISSDNHTRVTSGLQQFDNLLAGGFLQGQTILLGGEPGIGKSTLLLQLSSGNPTLYVAGEESVDQIKIRAKRLGVNNEHIDVLDVQDVDVVAQFLRNQEKSYTHNKVVIVDSIQSLFSSQIRSVSGSIAQVQYCATLLNEVAKKYGYIMIFVGQVTKSGYLAGPKLLEHLVDTVMYFHGDRKAELRALRVVKNRFGPAFGLEMFVMEENGLVSADRYFENLIAHRGESVAGSILSVAMEGNHPILVEVQALSVQSRFSNPRRVVTGYSGKRVEMLLAVIGKRLRLKVGLYDFYLNISGGIKVDDYSLDLPICLAALSIIKNVPISQSVVAFGEVGLLGEVKPVTRYSMRLEEANKRGYKEVVSNDTNQTLKQAAQRLGLI